MNKAEYIRNRPLGYSDYNWNDCIGRISAFWTGYSAGLDRPNYIKECVKKLFNHPMSCVPLKFIRTKSEHIVTGQL